MTIRIVTDSTCDLPEEIIQRLGIRVVPLYINVGSESYLDGIEISRQDFYERLPSWPKAPTTAAPSPNVFCNHYAALAEEGASEVLSIHISESLSATVNEARVGAEQCANVPVTVLDARQLSLGMGFVVEKAAQLAAAGASMADLLAALNQQIARTQVFAALNTLEYLRRSGRMSRALARLGTILQLKPILRMIEGHPTADRVRTTEAAWTRMLGWMEELAPFERVAVVHANDPVRAEALRQRAAHLLPAGEVPVVNITPVLGAHLGPGAVGFAVISA
jgi:DegV family protein with EDD domain